VDLAAVVGQFLINTRAEDLPIELVQNELDAGSSCTEVTFGEDAIVCQGDGESVDEIGWERLRKFLGAGGAVAAKADGIGVKNHGLRTGFQIGDEIIVQSGGWRIELTLYQNKRLRKFDPGTWSRVEDPAAPRVGARITIPYRHKGLNVPSGEGFSLPEMSPDRIRSLYEQFLEEIPERFLSAVAPTKNEYRLRVKHKSGDVHTFDFKRGPARVPGWPSLIRRTCTRIYGTGKSETVVREAAAIFPFRLDKWDHGRVPRLFRAGRRYEGEISWALDERGRPVSDDGRLRYPIGYPNGEFDAWTGYGFHVSAPFVSDTTRHGLAPNADRNVLLLQRAKAAMVETLRSRLLQKYGPEALWLLRAEGRPNPVREREIAQDLLRAGALLVRKLNSSGEISEPRLLTAGSKVTIAVCTDQPSRVVKELFPLAPPSALLLDERTPAFIVEPLTSLNSDSVVIWTDNDAVLGLTPIDQADKEARLSFPLDHERLVRSFLMLNFADRAHRRGTLSQDVISKLLNCGLLPTSDGNEHPWRNVTICASPPPPIDGVQSPFTLHSALSNLRLLREGPLRVQRFRLDNYLSRLDFNRAGKSARNAFLRWLKKQHGRLRPATLSRIAEYPIWPGTDGEHYPLNAFVSPRSEKLRSIMCGVVPQPSDALANFPGLRGSSRGALYLRKLPSEAELRRWYDLVSEKIRAAEDAGDASALIAALAEVESGLDHLLIDRNLAAYVVSVGGTHRTLSKDGNLVPVSDLHLPTREVEASECVNNFETPVAGSLVSNAVLPRLGAAWVLEG